jgi:hypothetical protein
MKISGKLISNIFTPLAKSIFYLNGAVIDSGLKVFGNIYVHLTRRGIVHIGKNCSINSGNYNLIGRQQKSIFQVEGKLAIGDNLGMSCFAIICNHENEIANNITI